ncbi:hypothetical protein HRbin40_00911 [bacterium HR40]|nr:hypothetical protein HRbin40_00911 [bacterium HR40]
MRGALVGLVLALLSFAGRELSAAGEPSRGELASRTAFRVCADPDNLPFSNAAGEGFENRIAELFAAELGLPVEYTWHPQTLGFIANTLRSYRCDVIIGTSAVHELVQNTRSYYRSTYVLVYRAEDRDRFSSLDSPLVGIARIGVVANTPPAALLVRRGLIANVRSYDLQVDTRIRHPAREAVEAVASGELDMALVWGPIGGYFAARSPVPLEWVPVASEPGSPPMDYRITMGVRFGETEWLDTLNELIRKKSREIEAILADYGVPLLDRNGRLMNPPPWLASPQRQGQLFDPLGYRIADYRAPVPDAPEGVSAAATSEVVALLRDGALALDVFPASPRPPGRPADALWLPPKRETIAGAVWLPNVGLGILPPDTAAYLRAALAALTGGDRARPLVFFCERDCWMSWNAARRARHELGFTRVFWYGDGTDGWREGGHPLVSTTPYEVPPHTQ